MDFTREPVTINGAEVDAPEQDLLEPIAVIGFSHQFPQEATTPEGFWNILEKARCVSTDFPSDRLDAAAFYHPDYSRRDAFHFKGGHFLKGNLGCFDAPFFSIKPAEAVAMDPHQRKLLEVSYRALENAGLPLAKVAGSQTSVYTASFADDYRLLLHRDAERIPTYALTGTTSSFLANRISWFYDLQGPSLNVDTACSSSLVAVDSACQNLRTGDSSMSIVTGGNMILDPGNMVALSNLNFLSPDSRCFSFDSRANGYAQGEGVGVVVLQRLSDAIRDQNCIRAVIRSTGTNSDGKTASISQPNPLAQEQLIRNTYRKAGLSLKLTRFFEAHATGTAQGDPIEAAAIGAVFSDQRKETEPLYCGAVKSNIGHLEGGSGIAGLIKTIMVLERGLIPPNANFRSVNPKIDTELLNIKLPQEVTPWPSKGLRRASINSFGFGGTNSHVVIEDAYHHLRDRSLHGLHCTTPEPWHRGHDTKCNGTSDVLPSLHMNGNGVKAGIVNPTDRDSYERLANGVQLNGTAKTDYQNGVTNGASSNDTAAEVCFSHENNLPKLLVWSAGDRDGINRVIRSHCESSRKISDGKDQEAYLEDLAHTLANRRSALLWKSFTIAKSVTDLCKMDEVSTNAMKATIAPRLAFAFTGQGAQWPQMGRELLSYPAFRTSLANADEYLSFLGCNWSLLEELQRDASNSLIHRPSLSQAICTAIQVALVDLLRTFSIFPDVVLGHSSGEIAAAYCTGAISSRSAWKISYYRGLLAETLSASNDYHGAMLSVGVSAEQTRPYIKLLESRFGKCEVVVACVNSPSNVTLSGKKDQLLALIPRLEEEGVFNRLLRVDVGYHSPQMTSIAQEYYAYIEGIEAGVEPSRPAYMVSTLKARRVSIGEVCNAQYWVDNMTMPVRFSEAMERIADPSSDPKGAHLNGDHQEGICVNSILEVGPHSALQGPVKDCLKGKQDAKGIEYDSVLKRSSSAFDALLGAVGKLYCGGHTVDLSVVNKGSPSRRRSPRLLVDLPQYPFDDSNVYWPDTLVDKGYRFRGEPRNDLLGTRVPDWNPLDAKWQNIIKVSELSWVKDHVVNGAILYPGAGMIVMAIEAARQTSGDDTLIRGFEVRNVMFQKSLIIPIDSPGVEVAFTLRRLKARRNKLSSWSEWILSTYENGQWLENCRGIISVEQISKRSESENFEETCLEVDEFRQKLQIATSRCSTRLEPPDVYQCFRDCGLEYGPAFTLLKDTFSDGGDQAVSKVQLYHEDENTASKLDYIIHPTTLDAFFHLLYVGLTRGCAQGIPTSVPTNIRRLWISREGLRYPEATDIVASSQLSRLSPLLKRSSLVAMSAADGMLRIVTEGVETTAVANMSSSSQETQSDIQRYHRLEWKPDFSLMENSQILDYVKHRPADAEPKQFYEKLTLLLLMFVSNTLTEISAMDPLLLDKHHQKYIQWMQMMDQQFQDGTLPDASQSWKAFVSDSSYRSELCNEIRNSSAQGKLFVEVGTNLSAILRGELDIHELLFQDSLAETFYQDLYSVPSLKNSYMSYLDVLAHKNPNMKILEVGAGTGGATVMTLEGLSYGESEGNLAPRYGEYEFTDVSPSFFEKARQRFPEHVAKMKFKLFDIGEDPISQGLEPKAYDAVLAFGSIHITKDLSKSIRNARKLLRPGGKLILGEITREDILRSSFAFGLFSDWWLSAEDYREWGPSVSEAKWNELLTHNGFSGNDLVIRDYDQTPCGEVSIIISTAIEEPTAAIKAISSASVPSIKIVVDPASAKQMEIASLLQGQLISASRTTEVLTLPKFANAVASGHSRDDISIFLLELEIPKLDEMDEARFRALKDVLLATRQVLWVTGGGGQHISSPGFGVIDGLARALRNENGNLKLITVALCGSQDEPSRQVAHIYQVLSRKLLYPQLEDDDQEYTEKDNILGINRFVQAEPLQRLLVPKSREPERISRALGSCPPLKLAIRSPGLLGTLEFVEDKEIAAELEPDEIEIKVRGVGITIVDCLAAMGRYKEGWIGGECAGTVTRAGINCDLQKGDAVAFVGLDSFKTLARSRCAVKIPSGVSFAEAASIPTSFTLACYALEEVARVRLGESVLITHAACGVGQACLQISKHIGADVYVTVGSTAEKKSIEDIFGLPSDRIFYHGVLFAKGIRRLTHGRGVDVILNALDEDGTAAAWDCIAPFGRFVEVGPDAKSDERRLRLPPSSSVSYSTTNLRTLLELRPKLAQTLLAKVMDLIAAGKLRAPDMLYTYKASDIEAAFRDLLDRQNSGKTVVMLDDDAIVQCKLDPRPAYNFDPEATYLISGGLGTCGRILSHWMVSQGVRYLILLSRSGGEAAHEFIDTLRAQGARVEAPACDVSNRLSLEPVLKQLKDSMPPIKGCIHAAVVIKDSIFENMSFSDWDLVTGPKIRGSWNLHSLLPAEMDFFLLLSSMAGPVGFSTQANYAAGNTYQDALARFRRAKGLRAASLNLGPVDFDSPYSRDPVVKELIFRSGNHILQPPAELCTMIDAFCAPRDEEQVLLGLNDPANIRAQGKTEPAWMRQPLFTHFYTRGMGETRAASAEAQGGQEDVAALLSEASSAAEAGAVVTRALIRRLASILAIAEENFDEGRPMHAYGVDSLVAVEIRNWVAREMRADLAIFDIMGATSLRATGALIAGRSKYRQEK